jgi:hypothetical protein
VPQRVSPVSDCKNVKRKKYVGIFTQWFLRNWGKKGCIFLRKKHNIFLVEGGGAGGFGIPRMAHIVILSNISIRIQCVNAQVGEKLSNHYRNNDWVILLLGISYKFNTYLASIDLLFG